VRGNALGKPRGAALQGRRAPRPGRTRAGVGTAAREGPWGPGAARRGLGRPRRRGRGAMPPGAGEAVPRGRATRTRARGGESWDARGGKRKGRQREREGERGEGEAHLGIRNPTITVTGSPRARGGRERWKRGRGSCCVGQSNERERGGAHGGFGRQGCVGAR
jgi:hypothetical protein